MFYFLYTSLFLEVDSIYAVEIDYKAFNFDKQKMHLYLSFFLSEYAIIIIGISPSNTNKKLL